MLGNTLSCFKGVGGGCRKADSFKGQLFLVGKMHLYFVFFISSI